MRNLQKTPKTALKKLERIGRKTKAISPVVATLILIIVAIVGAISVGLIVSNISTNTQKQANVGNAQQGAQSTLLIGGSTTVYPITLAAQQAFQTKYGAQLVLSQGGSNAGMQGVISGALDIGAASSSSAVATAQTFLTTQQTAGLLQGVTLNPVLIGGSGIVVIENGPGTGKAIVDSNLTPNNCLAITRAALQSIYLLGTFGIIGAACTGTPALLDDPQAGTTTASTTICTPGTATSITVPGTTVAEPINTCTGTFVTYTAVSRSDNSGTEDTFTAYVGLPNQANNPAGLAGNQQAGNAGVLSYVNSHANTIGFADIGFAEGKATGVTCTQGAGNACGVAIPQVETHALGTAPTTNVASGASCAALESAIKTALKDLSNVNPLTNAGAVAFYPDTTAPGTGLARTFYYVTNGTPTTLEQTFLSFITSPNAETYFSSNGYFSVYDYTGA